MVNFGLDDVIMKLLALFQDEHIISQNDSIFVEAMESFEARQLFMIKYSFDEPDFLFCISYTSNETIFISSLWIDYFIVLQKLVIVQNIL